MNIFQELRSADKKTLMPFLTAGYPNLETTGLLLREIQRRGAKICELGFPFSDPIADGPTIQASYTEALDAGVTVDGIFDTVRKYRADGGALGLCAMVSYSIVFRRGFAAFCKTAFDAGFDGLIVPDLPLGSEAALAPHVEAAGLCNVMLIAPTTPSQRKVEIAKASRGFVYYISIAGITGERDKLPEETIRSVAELRTHTETPICVGFGISNARTVQHVCEAADGAIVGSAIIHRVTDGMKAGKSNEDIAQTVGEFVEELIAPVK
ncbi:MAG: tryptophan synthase subunit alpha [Phycisphaerae bacterium]|nr:tryptophan synthase subunit alpha [Phycisphaerae bacterium]